jgi:hypothetical protein
MQRFLLQEIVLLASPDNLIVTDPFIEGDLYPDSVVEHDRKLPLLIVVAIHK